MHRFFRSFFTVSFYTLLSRILGFVRDIFIAKYLGSTVTADAFFVAFRLPNFFRRVLAEGAYSAALIPVFSGVVIDSKDDKEAAENDAILLRLHTQYREEVKQPLRDYNVWLDQLQAACVDGKVQELKGFAAKTEQSILDGIAIAAAANSRIRWAVADKLAETLREHLPRHQAIRYAAR